MRDKVKLVVCRHEASAANMAEAYGKLTNRPGLCFVTRGPGATNVVMRPHSTVAASVTFANATRKAKVMSALMSPYDTRVRRFVTWRGWQGSAISA